MSAPIKKTKRIQVTCNCSAYEFPHRIGGGNCTGSEWASSYFGVIREACSMCNCLNSGESGAQGERSGTCDVAEGIESVKMCEAYQEHLHDQPIIRLPITEGDYFQSVADAEFCRYED